MTLAEARDRIAKLGHLHAFISLAREEGEGTVVAVKDLIDVRGTVTTGGGTILPAVSAAQDAPVITRIRESDGIIVGKTNLHEWAYGITSVNPHYGAVLNPHDQTRVAGGSSGGSAVAVACGMCDWAVGTDTGGSIRIPAALCGVVGFKPTFGAISNVGVLPLSPSLDTVGPLATDVQTAARAFAVMAGRDLAAASPNRQPELAVPRGWVEDLDPATSQAWSTISSSLAEIDFPDRRWLAGIGLTILLWEAAEIHKNWVERYPDRYGEDVLALLQQGLEMDQATYHTALEGRDRAIEQVALAMEGLDAIVLPTTACVAPTIQDQMALREPLTRYTRPFNTTGQPAISLPAPVSGLPVGLQVVGRRGDDEELLGVAGTIEARLLEGEGSLPPT